MSVGDQRRGRVEIDVEFDSDLDVGATDVAGADFELDAELDVAGPDIDVDIDSGADTASAVAQAAEGIGEWVASLFTFRTIVFVSAFFGAAGIVFTCPS